MCNTKKVFSLFLSYFIRIIHCSFLENDIQELFRESKCIEEPSTDYFVQYLATEPELFVYHDVENGKNYRSEINSLTLYHNLENSYTIVDEKGPAHSKVFNISLNLGDEIYYGVGKSKKEAKEMAAKIAFENTSYQKPPIKIDDDESNDKDLTPTVMLNNLGAKNGYKISYYILAPMDSKRIINLNKVKNNSLFTNSSFWKEAAQLEEYPKSPFNIEVSVNENSFYGKAHTIQEAKHNAAAKAIQSLKAEGKPMGPCGVEGDDVECKRAKNKLKSPISLIYEFGQSERLDVEFKEISQSGPAHKPNFEFECRLGTFRTLAEGKSKKEAKRKAAEKMLETIPHLDFSSQSNSNVKQHTSNSHKKAKNNKAKSKFDIASDFVKNTLNFFSSNEEDNYDTDREADDKQPKKDQKPETRSKKSNELKSRQSPKEQLLDAGKALNLKIQFHTMPRKNSGYYSVINLDLNPKYICIGSGSNVEISQEYSALNALKLLQKLDLLNSVDEKDLDIKRFSFDNYIWLTEDTRKE